MWRWAVPWRSQFVDSRINQLSDDNSVPLQYHVRSVMCEMHIDDK